MDSLHMHQFVDFSQRILSFVYILGCLLVVKIRDVFLAIGNVWSQSSHYTFTSVDKSSLNNETTPSDTKECHCNLSLIQFIPRCGIQPFPGDPSPSPPYYCPLHRPKLDDLSIDSIFDDGISNEPQNGSRDENDSKLANSLGDWPTHDSTSLEKLDDSGSKPGKLPPPTTSVDKITFGAFLNDGTKQLAPLSTPFTSKIEDFNKPLEYDENGHQVFKSESFDALPSVAKKEMNDIEEILEGILKEIALAATMKVR